LKRISAELGECRGLRELYLDHNQLTSIPASLASLPNINIISLSGNHLTHLPHFPFLSNPRLLLEDNKYLTYIPYLVGCQQTLISYANQASWAALSQVLVENTFNGVWSLRVNDCGLTSYPRRLDGIAVTCTVDYSEVSKRKLLFLPPTLERVFTTTERSIPSLRELSLKVAYTNWRLNGGSRLRLISNTPPNIQTHASRMEVDEVTAQNDGKAVREVLPDSLLQTLRAGPTSFCAWPQCSKPILTEACLEIIPKEVQRSLWGASEPEIFRVLASRLYCCPACRNAYIQQSSLLNWELKLLNSSMPWEKREVRTDTSGLHR